MSLWQPEQEEANQPHYRSSFAENGYFSYRRRSVANNRHPGGSVLGNAESYRQGAVVAGTSAGASAMSTTMLVGVDEATPSKEIIRMAPLGLLSMVVDQHFAQRQDRPFTGRDSA